MSKKKIFCTYPFILSLCGYLDPGSGSILFTILITGVSLLAFLAQQCFVKLRTFFYTLYKGKASEESRLVPDVLIHSEGKRYWTLFAPLIDMLLKNTTLHISYWSADEDDPGLKLADERLCCEYVGATPLGFARLSTARAVIMLTTTPSLDIFQIRRSSKVKHYCYLFHSPVGLDFYKMFSFDYFDSVMLSGQHQKEAFQQLEKNYDLTAKKLLETGLLYYDTQLPRSLECRRSSTQERLSVLVAPSWGEIGLLKQSKPQLLKLLLDAGYAVTLRPHPQTLQIEKELLKAWVEPVASEPHFQLDSNPDNLLALANADLLISDLSGVVFDFIFLFQRPVLTLASQSGWEGYEKERLQNSPWVIEALEELAASWERIEDVPKLVAEQFSDKNWSQKALHFRNRYLYNYGQAAAVAAHQLEKLHQELQEDAA